MIYGGCRKEGARIHQCTLCKHRIYGCEEYEKQLIAFGKPFIKIKNKDLPGGFSLVFLDKDLLNIHSMEE